MCLETLQDTDKARSDIPKYNLGGLIVYGADFTSVEGKTATEAQNNFKMKVQSFQNSASLPLLIGVDQEGGTVSRLSQINGKKLSFTDKRLMLMAEWPM